MTIRAKGFHQDKKMTQEECRNQFRDLNERALQLAELLKQRELAKAAEKGRKK